MQPVQQRRIRSYGLDRSVISWVLRPESVEDVSACIEEARRRRMAICPAGGRNSFGDVFLLGDHISVDMTGLDRILAFDAAAGTITVEAGALEPAIPSQAMPAGWYLPASSGSLWNTVGGDLSSHINGKDSWKLGGFGDQVESFQIALADGSRRRVDRNGDPSLFAAVMGGLGLLGIVTEVTLRLRRARSLMVEQTSRPIADAEGLVEAFTALRPEADDFAYAWLDAYATGRALGRSVFETARFAEAGAPLDLDEFRRGFVPRASIAGLPPRVFWGIVSRGWKVLDAFGLSAEAFRLMSEIKVRGSRRAGERRRRVTFPHFQYPMVRLFPHWNLKFAPEGFNEIQALFPAERFVAALDAVLSFCRRHRRIPEVCAVRRHRADEYPLSFAGDGLSLTLPLPLAGFRPQELDDYRARISDAILAHGGKVYLSKFPYLDRGVFRSMYPRWQSFVETKERVDPECRFWSETAERLLFSRADR